MQYSKLLPALCIIALSLGSCKKDYTCHCDTGGWDPNPVDIPIKARNAKAAKEECRTMFENANDAPTGCDLK